MTTTTRWVWTTALALITGTGACSSSTSPGTTLPDDAGGAREAGTTHDAAGTKDGATTKDGAKTTDTGPAALTATAFCTDYVAAQAKVDAKCAGGPEAAWQAQFNAATLCSEVAAAVTAKRVTYDVTQTEPCLTAMASLGCQSTGGSDPEPASCQQVFQGTVATGGACSSALDCKGASFCSGLGGSEGSCSGTCKPEVAAGDACAAGDVCVSGYLCAGSTPKCTAITTGAAKGETCVYDKSTKKAAPLCQVGLACDLTTHECVTPIAEGEKCPPGHSICAPFTYCDPTSTTCKLEPTVGGKCGDELGEDAIGCIGQSFCKGASQKATAGTCVALVAADGDCEATILAPADRQCASGTCSVTDGGSGSCSAVCTKE